MTLTEERAEALAQYLADEKEDRSGLFELEASEAVEKINADGYDFTAEELREFAEIARKVVSEEGELDENSLDDVAGGGFISGSAFKAGIKLFPEILRNLPRTTIGPLLPPTLPRRWRW